jgi:hypothetical protein
MGKSSAPTQKLIGLPRGRPPAPLLCCRSGHHNQSLSATGKTFLRTLAGNIHELARGLINELSASTSRNGQNPAFRFCLILLLYAVDRILTAFVLVETDVNCYETIHWSSPSITRTKRVLAVQKLHSCGTHSKVSHLSTYYT